MNLKTYVISMAAVIAISLFVEYVGYHFIFRSVRKKYQDFFSEEQNLHHHIGWLFIAVFLFSIFFVQLYTLHFIGTGPITGMKFGFAVGVLVSLPRIFLKRYQTNVIWEYEMMFPLMSISESMIAGIVVGWLFR